MFSGFFGGLFNTYVFAVFWGLLVTHRVYGTFIKPWLCGLKISNIPAIGSILGQVQSVSLCDGGQVSVLVPLLLTILPLLYWVWVYRSGANALVILIGIFYYLVLCAPTILTDVFKVTTINASDFQEMICHWVGAAIPFLVIRWIGFGLGGLRFIITLILAVAFENLWILSTGKNAVSSPYMPAIAINVLCWIAYIILAMFISQMIRPVIRGGSMPMSTGMPETFVMPPTTFTMPPNEGIGPPHDSHPPH